MAEGAAAEAGLVRLLVFGDSYVADPHVPRTWPVLLADGLGWRAANFAVPGSGSVTLGHQLERAARLVRSGDLALHPGAWAVVHTGGNDLMRSSAPALGALLSAEPKRKAPIVNALPEGDAPIDLAASGPLAVSSVDDVRIEAQHRASR